jgi:hypothetical protein
MEVFPHMKGTAAAMLGSLELLVPALVVYIVKGMYDDTILPVAIIILVCALCAFIILMIVHPKGQKISQLSSQEKKTSLQKAS